MFSTATRPIIHRLPYGGVDVMKTLVDAGAKVDARDVRKMTPPMMAIATDHGDPRTIRLRLDRGADRNAKDIYGQTAADWALKANNPAVLKELGIARAAASSRKAAAGPAIRRT